ncbi:hypothetical protein BT63DRAFT_465598 [Microthyrium microscopicum]|uniref:Uncharacterized protein n=1 Tax=Microthyrium microscopicum TaxID=703497 RepID=A0A6A6TVS0_9PEZI|nr:hypothetical protein BT63DRAFT_465598 [Microthyrium microscopicum]
MSADTDFEWIEDLKTEETYGQVHLVTLFKALLTSKTDEATPTAIAWSIDTLFYECLSGRGEETEEEAIELFLFDFWQLLLSIVLQCPFSKLDLLVQLVGALRKIISQDIELDGAKMKLWGDLPLLERCFRLDFKDGSLMLYVADAPRSKQGEYMQEWVRQNSFAARIYGKHYVNMYPYAEGILRTTFEQPRDITLLPAELAACREWLLYGGSVLFNCIPLKRWKHWKKNVSSIPKDYPQVAVQALEIQALLDKAESSANDTAEVASAFSQTSIGSKRERLRRKFAGIFSRK